jgi:type IV pilus assembly protein PilE
MRHKIPQQGLTLVELMIVIAILSIVTAIAIPAYNGYIKTGRDAAARANVEPLRLALEDYFLENNTYVAGTWVPSGTQSLQTGALGWHPDGDENKFNYSVVAAGGSIANGYTITVTHVDDATATVSCTRIQSTGSFNCS